MLKPQISDEIEGGVRQRVSSSLSGRTIVAALLGALAVGALWLATAFPVSRPLGPPSVIHSDLGDLKVDFMIQTSPGSASGSTLEGVSDLEFHPTYVVVKGRDGSGRIFVVDKIQSLSWRR